MTSVTERLSALERDVAALRADILQVQDDAGLEATPAHRRMLRRLERVEREVRGLVRWASGRDV